MASNGSSASSSFPANAAEDAGISGHDSQAVAKLNMIDGDPSMKKKGGKESNYLRNNPFLVLSTRLYKRVCPSVRRLVGRSVRPSVTSFFGGQKQRRRTTYAVYPALFFL